MKAIVFTTDAIFAMIISSIAVTILLYFTYAPIAPLQTGYSETQSILNTLTSVSTGGIANNTQVAMEIAYQGRAGGSGWGQYMGNASRESSSPYGPLAPSLDYKFNSWGLITLPTVEGYGNVYFAAGSTVAAINSSSGAFVWNASTSSAPNSIALYNNLLLYSTTSAVSAVYADTGKSAWTVSTSSGPTSQLLIYNGYAILGNSGSNINAYFANNGALAWSSSLAFKATSLAVANGSIVASSSAGGLGVLTAASGNVLWYSVPSNPVTTGISAYNNEVAYGSNNYDCAFYINDTLTFCSVSFANAIVTGVSVSNGDFVYQSANSVSAISPSGSTLWNTWVSSYGNGIEYPVSSGRMVYSEWSGASALSNTLIGMNLSTGNVEWTTRVPYGIGNMSLGYGRLYTTYGSNIIAYGACNSNSQASIFQSAVNLYASGDGSCATALLNSVYPVSNSSAFMNTSFLPEQRLTRFNGVNSIMTASISNSLNSYVNGLAYLAWFNTSLISGQQGIVSQGTPSGLHAAMYLNGNQLECDLVTSGSLGSSIYNAIVPSTLSKNSWYQGGLVFNSTTGLLACYLNGVQGKGAFEVASAYTANTALTMGSYNGVFNGVVSDVQVYNNTLTGLQMNRLYQEGMQGGPIYGNSLVAWYPLDGDTNDYGGYNNTAYPMNVVYEYTGYEPTSLRNSFELTKTSVPITVSSYAPQFNGASSYIDGGTRADLNTIQSGITVGAWIYARSTSGTAGIVSRDDLGSNRLWEMRIDSGALSAVIWTSSTDYWTSGYAISSNVLYYAVFTYDGSNVRLYVNGVQKEVLAGGGNIKTGTSHLTIGSLATTQNYFSGLISNVQVYNTSLSAKQIASLYSEGMGGAPLAGAGLVGWWPLNGNTNDYGGQGNNGSPNNLNYTTISSLYSAGIYSWK